MAAHAKKSPPPVRASLAELIQRWTPGVRAIFGYDAELDFAFVRDAITICDMRVPNALRYGDLFTRKEIEDNVHLTAGEVERRVRAFMARG